MGQLACHKLAVHFACHPGTLTVSNIDYVTMRKSVDIPVGDLFTVMESWDDGDRIK